MITADQVQVAKQAAVQASNEFFQNRLGGRDQFSCGFAWTCVAVTRTNSRQAKELIKAGFLKHWTPKMVSMWNPGEIGAQNVDAKLAGATAMAEVLRGLGLDAFADSRLD